MFIVFEGTDGSGTSTQATCLAEFFKKKGKKVLHTVEPSSSDAGVLLRQILTHQKTLEPTAAQLLFFADRMHHLKTEIEPALLRDEIVICERYVWSSLAYGKALGANETILLDLSPHYRKPDFTIFLDLPESLSLHRIKQRGKPKELFEKQDILKKVRIQMQHFAATSFHSEKTLVIDASNSLETISKKIQDVF